jgi:hypothetical protein
MIFPRDRAPDPETPPPAAPSLFFSEKNRFPRENHRDVFGGNFPRPEIFFANPVKIFSFDYHLPHKIATIRLYFDFIALVSPGNRFREPDVFPNRPKLRHSIEIVRKRPTATATRGFFRVSTGIRGRDRPRILIL